MFSRRRNTNKPNGSWLQRWKSKQRIFGVVVVAIFLVWNSQWDLSDPYAIDSSTNITTANLLEVPASNLVDVSDPAVDGQTDDRPHNLHIAFVGDSLSRYMYLSLCFYLKHGTWAERGARLLEKVKDPDPEAWNKWLMYSNDVLQPQEGCDCYRYWVQPFQWYKHCENRFFQDEPRGNYITFITRFGGNPFHGHWNASQVFGQPRPVRNVTKRHYSWVHPTWSALVDDYLSKLSPKPNWMIFNQGHWKGHDLRERGVLEELRDALQRHGIRGLYRTTTFRRDEPNYAEYKDEPTRRHDAKVCQYFDCLNVSWTADTPTTDYVDDVHFTANINNDMNQQLLREYLQLG